MEDAINNESREKKLEIGGERGERDRHRPSNIHLERSVPSCVDKRIGSSFIGIHGGGRLFTIMSIDGYS